jgi:hypothetical protein
MRKLVITMVESHWQEDLEIYDAYSVKISAKSSAEP